MVSPGAFNSTKAILPPGKRTKRSGTPFNPGETNLTASPPRFFTSAANFFSTTLSFTKYPPVPKCCSQYQKSYTRVHVYTCAFFYIFFYLLSSIWFFLGTYEQAIANRLILKALRPFLSFVPRVSKDTTERSQVSPLVPYSARMSSAFRREESVFSHF